MKTKKCKSCGNEKALTCFYVRKRDGWVFAKCKDCYLKSDRRRGVEVASEYREQGTNQKRKWRKRNPEAEKSYDANKRAKRAGVDGVLTKQDVETVWQKYGGLCWVCGERAEQLDHFRPINPSGGGTNTPDNIRPICFECNHKRSHIWYGAEKAEREAQMIKQIQEMLRGKGTPSAESDCSAIESKGEKA